MLPSVISLGLCRGSHSLGPGRSEPKSCPWLPTLGARRARCPHRVGEVAAPASGWTRCLGSARLLSPSTGLQMDLGSSWGAAKIGSWEAESSQHSEGAGRCFWGDFFLCSLPPRTQRSPRKPGRGKHFATWLLHAPAKETILQLKEEIRGPGYFQPLLFVTQLAAFRAERRDCATLHVLFRPFNFSIARRIRGIEKSPVLRKEETCDSDT